MIDTKPPQIENYKTIVFDCDGVILNSNKIKTEAFYSTAKAYGHNAAQSLVDYHIQNGGISRYKKFNYFFENILKKVANKDEMNKLLCKFSVEVKKRLLKCDIAAGLEQLHDNKKKSRWMIVSGGDQAELQAVFKERGIAHYFDGGIFGSPDIKEEILRRELKNKNIQQPSLFIGDSKYDYLAASTANMDFIFLSDWSEVHDWEKWAVQNNLRTFKQLRDLLE